MNRRILNIAIPSIVSNITVPLLGLVDMAISGHMGDAVYIGAVAVGSMIFNVIYWLFGFLRMGTSGMTSQSLGRRDLDGVAMLLTRSMGVALLIGLTIVVFQYPIGRVALMLTGATADISSEAWVYFRICVWGVPAMLCLYGLTGWYIGMQNTRLPMFISILQNIVNIAASFTFVYVMGMKVEGVALGTLVAQYAGLVVSLALCTYTYGNRLLGRIRWRDVFEHSELSRFFTVNRDIFLRTLFMVAVNFYFLSAGASQGAVVLAVNTLLMQLFTLFSYVMDGFAYAGEALCGRLYGAGNSEGFARMVRRLFMWGLGLSVVYTLVYALGGSPFLMLLTDNASVIDASASYVPWAVFIPLCGMAAFIWDGVFIGITATRGMLLSSAIASVLFFVVYLVLRPMLHNHALWIAFLTYLAMRGVVQTVLYNKWSRGKGSANKDR
ncbi:MATE family efflux transporter [uncultured Prevotella sp.]|uniref:MATE family efflux transporter n=1 Tax=uncultured Prevotella sp. TaxID=159272 RepID=UPI00260D2927|nr:MATE family efflux transporter [uncultured Prevotella sp.]